MTLLRGKVVVVTGASRGIGAAIAARLGAEGAQLVRLARTLRAARTDTGLDLPCDLTQEDDVAHAAARVLAEFGAPDVVVSNAGAFLVAPLEETSAKDLDGQMAANLRAPFLVARAFLPPMRQEARGHHVAIGSIADHEVFPENAAYTASKFALRGLHEVLRKEYHGSGLRFTLISPGPTDTRIWDPVDPDHRPGFLPRRAMLHVDDVAEVVLFVVSRPPRVAIDWVRVNPS